MLTVFEPELLDPSRDVLLFDIVYVKSVVCSLDLFFYQLNLGSFEKQKSLDPVEDFWSLRIVSLVVYTADAILVLNSFLNQVLKLLDLLLFFRKYLILDQQKGKHIVFEKDLVV